MKSSRQKRIEKYAALPKKEKKRKYSALFISAVLITIPIFLTYVYG